MVYRRIKFPNGTVDPQMIKDQCFRGCRFQALRIRKRLDQMTFEEKQMTMLGCFTFL